MNPWLNGTAALPIPRYGLIGSRKTGIKPASMDGFFYDEPDFLPKFLEKEKREGK